MCVLEGVNFAYMNYGDILCIASIAFLRFKETILLSTFNWNILMFRYASNQVIIEYNIVKSRCPSTINVLYSIDSDGGTGV